jgi:hypothetical protein
MDEYKFEMKGRAFDEGDRLDKLAAGLTALQHIFDAQYRTVIDKKRLSEQDRGLFQVRVTRYEDGSFIAYLGAIYTGLQLSLPLFSGTPTIWETTQNAFEFIKALYELAHKGEECRIVQNGNDNTVISTGDIHQVFNGPVYALGSQMIGALREFDDLLENEEVERIALEGPDGMPVILLSSDMKGLFYPPTKIDETPIKLTCDIYDFNKYDKAGRTRVPQDQPIPPGNYKFRNIGDQTVDEFILSMTEPQVTLSCLIKYQHDPLSENRIAEILVMQVAS